MKNIYPHTVEERYAMSSTLVMSWTKMLPKSLPPLWVSTSSPVMCSDWNTWLLRTLLNPEKFPQN